MGVDGDIIVGVFVTWKTGVRIDDEGVGMGGFMQPARKIIIKLRMM
jgi:hypothetical protein